MNKKTFQVWYRGENPPGGYLDRYMFDGICEATPEAAVMEHAMCVLGLDEGAASDLVHGAKIVIVDDLGNKIKGHKVQYT